MIKPALYERIKQFGFSEYESKCYLALFERESLAVSDISKLANIPRSNTYGALERLLDKGLVALIPGKRKKYSVSDPRNFQDMSLEMLDQNMNEELIELERKRQEVIEKKKREIERKKISAQESITGIVNELRASYQRTRDNGDPLDYIEILRSPIQIHRKFLELYSKTQREVVAFIKPPFAHSTEKQMEEQRKVQDEGVKRGVIRRAIFELKDDEQAREFLTSLPAKTGNVGEQYRVIDRLPIKFFVFDEYACYFALEDPISNKTSLTMLIAEHNALAMSFKILFDTFWEKAQDHYIIDGKKYFV